MSRFLIVREPTEEEARRYVERVRWPAGPVCPHCGADERVKRIEGGATRPGLLKCYACRRQFTVTTGTILHRSRIPLRKWVLAFVLLCCTKRKVTGRKLQLILRIGSYQTAWQMRRRIRQAIRSQLLAGMAAQCLRFDEAWVGRVRPTTTGGAHSSPGKAGSATILIERNGRVRARSAQLWEA